MRIAICLAGQLRTGIDCVPSLLRYVGDLLPSCDFFLHTWDVESYSSEGFGCERYDKIGLAPNDLLPLETTTVYRYLELIKPKGVLLGSFSDWNSIERRVGHDPHLYSVKQVTNLKSLYEIENNFEYDYVLRTRPDLIYDQDKTLKADIAEIDNNRTLGYSQCFDLDVVANKIDNAFWIGSSYVMNQVSGFDVIKGNAHPEFHVDGFMHFGNWVIMGLGFNVKRLKNSKIAVYREFHKDLNKDPVNDFEFMLKTIGRF